VSVFLRPSCSPYSLSDVNSMYFSVLPSVYRYTRCVYCCLSYLSVGTVVDLVIDYCHVPVRSWSSRIGSGDRGWEYSWMDDAFSRCESYVSLGSSVDLSSCWSVKDYG
jgi:hypothetical protein